MKGFLKLYVLLSMCLANPDVDTRETNDSPKKSGLLFLVSFFANILFSALFDAISDRIISDIERRASPDEPIEPYTQEVEPVREPTPEELAEKERIWKEKVNEHFRKAVEAANKRVTDRSHYDNYNEAKRRQELAKKYGRI